MNSRRALLCVLLVYASGINAADRLASGTERLTLTARSTSSFNAAGQHGLLSPGFAWLGSSNRNEEDNEFSLQQLDAEYRLTARHRIRIGQFNVTRLAERGDDVPRIGAGPSALGIPYTSLDATVTEVGYSYSFIQSPTFEFAGIAGIHYIDNDISRTDANAGVSLIDSVASVGPAPLLGVDVRYHFTPSLHAASQAQVLTFGGNDIAGAMYDVRLRLEYSLREDFGFGVDYNVVNFDLSVDSRYSNGDFDLLYDTYKAYGLWRF